MTDRGAASPRTEAGKRLLAAIEAMEAVSVEWAPARSAPYLSKYIVLPVVEIWVRRIEAEAAQEAPAPEGLREALHDALYGLAGGVEHQQGEVRVRIEEAAAAIDTVLAATPPTPAEPPHPDDMTPFLRLYGLADADMEAEYESIYGESLAAVAKRAEARPPEGLDVDRLAIALAIAESQAPDDANDEERREWRDKAERVAETYARLSAGGATKP